MKGTKRIDVFIHFDEVDIALGKLILMDGLVHFKYEDSFIERGMNISPFKLNLSDEIQIAPLHPFNGIFGVFDDSLPDGWGMLLLNRALEKKGLSLLEINILDQLAYVGETGKGALIYRPAVEDDEKFEEIINLDLLSISIDKVYKGTSSEAIERLLSMGGSSGGARPKVNVGYNPVTDEIIHGVNDLPPAFEHWIIKFPSSYDPIDIANIEYTYHKIALLAGITMSECRLLKSKGGLQFFATKRFDRVGNHRLHMHSMAGLTHDNFRLSTIDYGHIMDAAYQLEQTAKARETVFRLAVFNVYGSNKDDHSKNFSWLMNRDGKWKFAPAYDLTYSSNSINEHSTTVAGEGANPKRENLLELATIFSIAKPEEIIDQVKEAFALWPVMAKKYGVNTNSINRIQERLKEIRKND